MRTHPAFITFVCLIVCSCNVQLDKPTPVLPNSTRINIQIQSDQVENLTLPNVIPAENSNIIKAGKPIVVLRRTNQKKAGTPSKIAAANPLQKTPGLGGVALPTVKPAGFVHMNAIIPEIVTAKEPYWKDQNPFNISTFSKAQGLKGNLVGSILEDKNGNIWLGTTYGGFSKYDGKSFYHYYQQDGPNPSVRSILEDESGVLWFGMQGGGVVRYDGHRFLRLTTKVGLSDDNVFSLLKDSSGNLWVGTLGGGLGKFDGTHFTNYTTSEGLIDNYIMCLMEDKSGNIWFGSYFGGLSKFDGKRFSHFTKEQGLSHNNVTSIHEDNSGLIWVGTKNGLNAFDGVSFSHYTTEEGLSSNDISEILEDKDGYMWFSTSGGGVNRYDGDKFVHITEVEGLSINYVSSMMEDKFGTLWFGTEGGGVSIYSKGFEQVTKKTGLGNNFVSSILEDRSGNLWFGTFSGGVSKYDGHKFTHYTKNEGLVSNHVSCMVEDTDGTMWFGTWEGISKFDGQTFTNYTSKDGLSGNMVWSLLIDQKGHLWIGLDKNGVNQFDGINFTQFSHIQGLGEKTVFSMLEDQRGYLWFGTSGSGLYNYDGEKYTHFTDGAGFDREYIWPIIEDQTGNIWVGTRGSGLKLLNLNQETNEITMSKFSVQEGLSNNRVTSLMISRKGDLWIGTGNGLNKMEQATLSLIGRSPNISLEKPLFNTYTVEEGFSAVGLNHGKTILEASDGTIWLGGDDRVMAFRPDAIPEDTTVPNIQLTGLTLFNEKVNWELFIKASSNSKETQLVDDHYTSNGVNSSKQTKNEKHNYLMLANGVKVHDIRLDGLSKWYGMPQDLSLPFDNNFITFEFVGITTKSPKKVKYRYKLEGLDQSWSALTTRSEAPYGNLSHGEYIFKVQAVNAAGIWSNELAYPFEIRPPWWLTWWAQFLYGLFVIGAVVGLRQYTVNRERMKHALNLHKLQTEKMQEIDHLKSRFFANISHEFRTPLTLILGPLEKFISQTLPQNPDRALFQMMQRNGKKLLHLINQLLDLSKIESGDMKLVLKPTDLNTFLEGVLLSFASLAEKKKIRYRMMCPAEKLVAYVDSDKLEIILVNLLSNAFKFTPELGEIIVTVQTIPLETKPKAIPIQPTDIACTGRSLEIIVKDSGEGIAEDQLNRIFDRFYQVSPTLHGDKEGSGIGLSLVKELVALHQGEIRVENQLQQGCCFIVKLPIWIANVVELSIDHREVNTLIIENTLSDMDKMQPVGPPEADVDRRDSEYPIILVIEDNEDVRLFIRETLKSTYQVMEADNGEVGYQMATENIPDLILSDVMMPNMDGITLSRCLKANTNTAHVPLILLTAKASGEDKIAGLETGADDYLIKPFNASELLVRINNLIENRRKLRDHFSREITLQPASVAITSADEKFLNLAVAIIEANMADPTFGVDTFSREVGMSRTQLFRKLKALTNYPPGDFIRLMRLKKAAELLRVRAGNIGEVAFSVGFQDPSYFTKSFQKQFGKTPSDFLAANTSESKSAAPN